MATRLTNWKNGIWGATMDHGPLDQGFDEFFGFRGGFIDYYSHKFLHANWQRPQFHDLYKNKEEYRRWKVFLQICRFQRQIGFCEESKNDPFFLYVPFSLPHYPRATDSQLTKTI